ncbi:MAG TPA: hypothetical protein VFD80_09415 [Flavobacteriaceae bacterium]|nr:hypothetical protein [Flavobacteriaceae bacterium]
MFLVLVFLSCKTDNDQGIPCTTEAKAGLNVTVKDAETQLFLYEEVTVVATDGDFSETLQLMGGVSPVFTGVWEREGSYTIEVNGLGYQSYMSDIIEVVSDECHVIPHFLEIILQPI